MALAAWNVFSGLSPEFVNNVKLALTVGCRDVNCEQVAGMLVLKNDDVYSVGSNLNACLGVPDVEKASSPVKVSPLCGKKVTNLVPGFAHFVALTDEGQVFMWGDNEFCQLGVGPLSSGRYSYTPLLVRGALENERVTSVACGFNHTIALTDGGVVYGWGFNKDGRVGVSGVDSIGPANIISFPTKVAFPEANAKIISVACGRQFSVALSEEGHVYCWGSNKNGQLGMSPVSNPDASSPTKLNSSILFKDVVCGSFHVLALSRDGECYFWGRDGEEAVAKPSKVRDAVTEIAATCLVHMNAIKTEKGSVYVWDRQSNGKCSPTPYLTNLASTDIAFAIWSEPAVMWRALNVDSISTEMLPPQLTQPALAFDTWNDTAVIPHLFSLKHGFQTCPEGLLTFNGGPINPVGVGCSGIVFRATYKGQDVAVKKLPNGGTDWLHTVHRELKALAAIGDHENVVKLIGAFKLPNPLLPSRDDLSDIVILMEYCELKDMRRHLVQWKSYFRDELHSEVAEMQSSDSAMPASPYVKLSSTHSAITTTDLIQWAIQFASGMIYLASKDVVHGDLALRNLLLTGSGILKVSDFGLSRRIHGTEYYRISVNESVPWAAAAPETFDNFKVSTASDVWGFGITLWEMFTLGEVPYFPKFTAFTLEFRTALKNGYRLPQPKYASDSMYAIMLSCWNLDPSVRPGFDELANLLRQEIPVQSKGTP